MLAFIVIAIHPVALNSTLECENDHTMWDFA